MAENTIDIAGASQDLQTIEDFVNLPAGSEVRPRLLPSVNVGTLAGTRDAIFKAGGLPANPFPTKAQMETDGAALSDGQLAQVYNETANNGLYVKTAGVWVKSDYDPVEQSKEYVDSNLNSLVSKLDGKNLYDKNKKIADKYIINTGLINDQANWSISDYIAVVEGQKYTISATERRTGLAFFTDKTTTAITGSYLSSAMPVTVTAPIGAKYLVINVDSNTITASNVQVESGEVATDYVDFEYIKTVKKDVLPSDVVYSAELKDAIADVNITKPYEINIVSKNLFDTASIVELQYLSSEGALAKKPSYVGWSTSDFIPVVAGQTYTLSGTRGRNGLSFFANKVDTDTPLSYYNTLELPLTVVAPPDANFVMFNVQQPSDAVFNNLQFQVGAVATTYEPYGSYVAIDATKVIGTTAVTSQPNYFEIKADGNAQLSAKSDIDVLLNIAINRPVSRLKSAVFNFESDSIDGVKVRTLGDDVSPIRADGFTVGANHGYSKTVITSAAHGKTVADIGSTWTDGAKQWVLLSIDSLNTLSVTAILNNDIVAAASLTHVSGAANTAAIAVISKVGGQWYPSIKNHTQTLFVDSSKQDINKVGKYGYSDNVAIHESYEIMAKADMVAWVIANKGVDNIAINAAPSVLYNNSYVFDKDGGCVVYTSLTAYKSVPFADYMGTQSVPFTNTVGRTYYVPKTVPFTQDATGYDFTALQPMTAPVTTSLFFDASKNEVGANPVDRLLQFSGDIGYATGYLPLLDAEPETRKLNAINKYLEVRNNSLKIYPRLIDGLKTTLAAGDSFAAIAYRKYFKKGTRTAKYVVRSNIADFLYLDWHTSKTDVIDLPDDLIGREFTVHEKSSNVTLLSAFATNNIAVKIDSTKSYGYLVLRFEK